MNNEETLRGLLVLAQVLQRQYKANITFQASLYAIIQCLKDASPNFEASFDRYFGEKESQLQVVGESDLAAREVDEIIRQISAQLTD